MSANPFNPYEPPKVVEPPPGLTLLPTPFPESRWGGLQLKVAAVERTWWRRNVRIIGSLDADIWYDPAGHGERVFVNGRLAATTSPWTWRTVAPHVDFELEMGEYAVSASIDVTVSMLQLMRLTRFRLTVAGRILYEE